MFPWQLVWLRTHVRLKIKWIEICLWCSQPANVVRLLQLAQMVMVASHNVMHVCLYILYMSWPDTSEQYYDFTFCVYVHFICVLMV